MGWLEIKTFTDNQPQKRPMAASLYRAYLAPTNFAGFWAKKTQRALGKYYYWKGYKLVFCYIGEINNINFFPRAHYACGLFIVPQLRTTFFKCFNFTRSGAGFKFACQVIKFIF